MKPYETNSAINISNLTVILGNQKILDNISFTVTAGAVVAIIGPNGSGKTTLLKAFLGLVPYTGEIKLFGQSPRDFLGQVGYVPQRFSFDRTFPLTVEEFLKFSSPTGKPSRLKHALKEVEMLKYGGKMLGVLSGGQLQRVLIARALLNDPKILFLDEPTAGVDVEGEKDFYQLLAHQNKEHGVTIVMVSHELSMVYAQASQVVCLDKHLICSGVPKQAITPEVLKKLYGGEINLAKHNH
ncbi:metal ABC transporter ATP-binding protein [Patescibacteria group bacterium]|nr:metal ABC transporter ATP-binding protein [Patescibacteria group bacterium]